MAETDKSREKHDYQILFQDSPGYFSVKRAKMIQEGEFVRFIVFDDKSNYVEDHWYPIRHIHRIKAVKTYEE